MKSSIQHNLEVIQQRINHACQQSNRNPQDVKLLLATKTVDADRIQEAISFGYPLIGENKVQEFKQKYESLQNIPHQSHFIGHLQTNKIKDVLKYVQCIQTVDRIDLAEKLDKRLQSEGRSIDILMQVNTSHEDSKFGVAPSEAIDLIKSISKLDTLKVKGLMTIGKFSAQENEVRPFFQILKNLQTQIKELDLPNVDMQELSMGMSGDLEWAIEEGATIVRVGTAIFGPRIYPDSYYWNEKK